MTLREIADLVGGRLEGDGSKPVTGVAGIEEAREGDVTFLANPRYLPYLDRTRAAVVLVRDGVRSGRVATIAVPNPDLAFAQVAAHLVRARRPPSSGIHPAAIVSPEARIGREVSFGAYSVVEPGAEVGDGTRVYPFVYVGRDAKVGPGCVLYPHSVVMDGCVLGAEVILNCGAVVGSDGFGFVNVQGVHHKVPQLGNVVVGDDVEVGANATIDRARFDRTVVEKGTKIDNLVQIGHNVEVGEHCLLVAQCGIAGSTTLGHHVVLGAKAGITGHLHIADRSVVAAGANRVKDTEPGVSYSGYYAVEHPRAMRQLAAVRRLPELVEEVRRLRAEVERLRTEK
ncbi:MAG: UDP-3-O-(3-hydroxymyristoyl)glucosamine N-acyltransferase [Planctomycetes bacterium]|nr:UDP-3-O-(3-hydroxymyristoyl)glucosamine N-acyltransferase [Planctomycetota bacterium]